MSDLFRKYKSLFSTTSNSFSTGSDVEITLNSVTGLPTDTDITLTFDRVDQNGVATSGNKMERIIGTISGSIFTIKERGADGTTEQGHTSPVVEMIWNAGDLNDMIDGVLVEHNPDGIHDIPAMITGGSVLDEDDMASNSATALATQQSIKAYADLMGEGVNRQAIINGNFDVWQRGTSIANTTANSYTADRWYVETATAGTDKTVSREDGTGVNGSYYCARVKMVSDVDELLTFSQALESQDSIKFRGQKVTLSFYARGGAEFVADNATLVSKIVTGKGTDQKVLAFTTSADAISQNNTLTTDWQKFTCTTTNVIASDITQIGISFAFTHAGSGTTSNYFEVTQVQLCAGDVALPFMPKSFEEELRACQRYYQKSWDYATAIGTSSDNGARVGSAIEALTGSVAGNFTVACNSQLIYIMRTSPTVVIYSKGGTGNAVSIGAGASERTGVTAQNASEKNVFRYLSADSSDSDAIAVGNRISFHFTADAEL